MNRDLRPDAARRRGLPLPAVLFLVVALLVGGLIPVGWMPSTQMPSTRGVQSARLVICTGQGAQLFGSPYEPAKPHPPHRHDACAFAGHLAGAAPATHAVSVPIAFVGATGPRVVFAAAPSVAAWRRVQAARAPPILI
jgi:hypothetical protein